jgi:two-component system, cell cycle response regulator DivK
MALILLADDDDDMVEICSRLLPHRGHRLVVARNAADAVTTAAAERPDLILMDMRMPLCTGGEVNDQAGLEAVRRLKGDPDFAAVPIIALTGHMMTNFRETILDAGCAGLLPKPIEHFADLTGIIDRHLAAG